MKMIQDDEGSEDVNGNEYGDDQTLPSDAVWMSQKRDTTAQASWMGLSTISPFDVV